MNKKQKISLWVGIIAGIVAICLNSHSWIRSSGPDPGYGFQFDVPRILLCWAGIVIVTGLLIILFRNKKKKINSL
jgi:hypothetical protein